MDTDLILRVIQVIAQFIAAGASIYAVYLVHNYTKKKDRVDFMRNAYHEAQMVNLHLLSSTDSLEDFEQMVYGDNHKGSRQEIKRRFHIFLVINTVRNYFFAKEYQLISNEEYEATAKLFLKMVKRQEQLVLELMAERGYSEEFRMDVERIFSDVTPPKN